MTTPANEPRRADGTDQPVVGSGIDQEAHWHARYVELKREFAEIDMQLAAHRYALELQNRAAGLPLDNEGYNKLPELLAEVRACLVQAANIAFPRWREANTNACLRWREAVGQDTANTKDQP